MEMLKGAGAMFLEASAGTVLGRASDTFLEAMENCCALDEPVLAYRVKSMVENLELCVPKMEKHMGDHQAELLEELKEGMTRGRTILNKLEASDLGWFKGRNNDQLFQLDAYLKSLVEKLPLQSAVDVKENGQVAKKIKRKADEMDEKFNDVRKDQAMMLNPMKKQEQKALANQVEQLFEGAALVGGLEEIADLTCKYKFHIKFRWSFLPLIDIAEITEWTLGLFDLKTAESEVIKYFREGELRNFRVLIEEGVDVLRKFPTILEWTNELESEYTNKFLDLERTIQAIYNRLAR